MNYTCANRFYHAISAKCTFAVTIGAHHGLGLDESEFTKSVLFFTVLGHTIITSVNNVVVTVLYVLRALYRRIIVYRILYKKSTHTSESSYGHLRKKTQSDCLLSRWQGLIGL